MGSSTMMVPFGQQQGDKGGSQRLPEVRIKLKMAVLGSDDGLKIDLVKYVVGDRNEFLKYVPVIGVGVTQGKLYIDKPDCRVELTEFLWVLGAGCNASLLHKHLGGASTAAIVVGAVEPNPKENAVEWLRKARDRLGKNAPVALVLAARNEGEIFFLAKLRDELKGMPEFANVQFYEVVLNVSQERALTVHGDLALALGSRES